MDSEYSLFENAITNDTVPSDTVGNLNTTSMMDENEPERLILYRNTIRETLRKITSSVKAEELMEMFKEIPSFSKKLNFNKVYNIFAEQVHDKVNAQIEEHIKDEELHQKFAALEKLIKINSINRDTVVWRPSSNVNSNLVTYIMTEKLKYKEQLMNLVNKKEDAVNKLKFDVTTDRSRISTIVDHVQAAQQKLALIDENMENLE